MWLIGNHSLYSSEANLHGTVNKFFKQAIQFVLKITHASQVLRLIQLIKCIATYTPGQKQVIQSAYERLKALARATAANIHDKLASSEHELFHAAKPRVRGFIASRYGTRWSCTFRLQIKQFRCPLEGCTGDHSLSSMPVHTLTVYTRHCLM